jgi:plastocyanin
MTCLRWNRLPALGVGLLLLACGGGGGSSGTAPCTPGAATQLLKNGGDAQAWYFNNPLPVALSVKALDANNCAVPGVVVNWAVATGGGAVAPLQTTTNTSGVASTTDSIAATTPQSVTATPALTSLPTLTFSATAATPPTSAAVSLQNIAFSPANVVVKIGGTVTWTWNDGSIQHNVTFTSGPASRPADSPTQATGTYAPPFTTVGTYGYHCTLHGGMNGTVTVVH